MAQKSSKEIVSVSQELVQKAVDEWGEPDLIIESAEATFRGMPDLDADPEARALVQRVHDAVEQLPDGESSGQAEAATSADGEAATESESATSAPS